MTITTVVVGDQTNPVEVQAWLTNNPAVTIMNILVSGNIFYLVHN